MDTSGAAGTEADQKAMGEAIVTVATMIAMNSTSTFQTLLQDMKKAADDAAEDSQT
jgi:hypothetical protein